MDHALKRFLSRVGRKKRDLAEAAGGMRYATVHDVVEGNHTPGVDIAKRLAEGTVVLAAEAGGDVAPVTPAEILGVAEWTPEAAE